MKQILLASAALLAVNGQQHLRRSTPVSDVIRPHILPVDLEPTIPENPILQPNYPITDIPEVPEIKADEFTAIPERLRPAIPERPSFNETHIPLNITKLPIYNVTLNATRPILRLPITIDPIERPIRITDPVLDYAIAADEELISIPPRLQPAIPERPIDFIPFNGTIDFPFNGTIKFPHFNETFFPIDRPIERPIYIDDPIEEPIAIAAADVAADELAVRYNGTFASLNKTIIDSFPLFNGTFEPVHTIRLPNGTYVPIRLFDDIERPIRITDPVLDYAIAADDELTAIPERLRPAIPERPILNIPIAIEPMERAMPVSETAIAADDELTAIPERLRPAIPERPIDRIPIIPIPTTIDPTIRPIPIPTTIDPRFRAMPVSETAIAADDELIVKLNATMIIDRFPNFNRTFNGTIDPRPAIPERPRPIDRIPLIPLTTTIAADDELTAIPERLRPAIPERPIDRIPIITDPIRPIPIPTIIDPSVRPIPIPTIIDPRVRPMPVSGTVIAAAADDELIVTPEILRPAIPERPIIKIPITIDPMERQPIPVIITDPPMRPIVVTDDDQLAIASF